MTYNIPKEISSEMKFGNKLYLFDLATLILTLFLASIFSEFVYESFRIAYYIFVAISTIFLVNKSSNNPKKRVFQSIYLALTRDKTTYIAE